MKKSLKLLFALSTVTTLPLSVMACAQQDLDSTLKKIYDNTETKFNIEDLLQQKEETPKVEKTLSIAESKTMVKAIAEIILETTDIVWFNENLEADTVCYDLKITNGKEENGNITWEVTVIDARIQVNVDYLVGVATAEKTFEAKQRITKTFNIKVGTTNSDNIVDAWVNKFNTKIGTEPTNVDLTSKEIEIPTDGGWADLKIDVITAIHEAIDPKVPSQVVTWAIQGNDKSISNGQLEVIITATLNDAKANTKPFMIKFV